MEKFITVTRVYNAPVESVWKTWVEPELIKRWWGPDRFSCPSAEIDFRESGKSVVCMQSKELGFGETYSLWEYKKIIPFERIEFIQNLGDAAGNRMKPVALGMPADFPEDVLTIVTFKAIGNKSEMTVTEYADFGSMSHFAQLGLEQSLGKMMSIFEL